ncbi:MAG: isoamylase early set domain-containing protein [Longimicrobiales bacterium]|nr:isoamylase early set domain-containing protein [Longimicrobiales bacterium]
MTPSDDPLDRYLAGEGSLDDLPDPLRREEERLRELLEAVREEPAVPRSIYESVMAEVRASPEPRWRRLVAWMTRPQAIRFRPATVGAALLVLGTAFALVPRNDPAVVEDAPAARTVDTRFVFVAPNASSVRITGDFVDWDPEGIALTEERGTGVWTLDLTLEPGVYQYGFVVDGEEWRPDPRAVSYVDDGFGRENSVVIVSEPSTT